MRRQVPIASPPSRVARAVRHPEGLMLPITPARFLVIAVDDNPCDLELLKEAFLTVADDVHLEVFTEGAAALAYLNNGNHVDLLITDLNMPMLDGVDLLTRLHTDQKLSGLPVILTSTCSKRDLPDGITSRLHAPYLSKPDQWDGYLSLARRISATLESLHRRLPEISVAQHLASSLRTPLPMEIPTADR